MRTALSYDSVHRIAKQTGHNHKAKESDWQSNDSVDDEQPCPEQDQLPSLTLDRATQTHIAIPPNHKHHSGHCTLPVGALNQHLSLVSNLNTRTVCRNPLIIGPIALAVCAGGLRNYSVLSNPRLTWKIHARFPSSSGLYQLPITYCMAG